jgi:hypothetical protein
MLLSVANWEPDNKEIQRTRAGHDAASPLISVLSGLSGDFGGTMQDVRGRPEGSTEAHLRESLVVRRLAGLMSLVFAAYAIGEIRPHAPVVLWAFVTSPGESRLLRLASLGGIVVELARAALAMVLLLASVALLRGRAWAGHALVGYAIVSLIVTGLNLGVAIALRMDRPSALLTDVGRAFLFGPIAIFTVFQVAILWVKRRPPRANAG